MCTDISADPPRRDVQSVRRAFDVLFAFSIEQPVLSVAEIAIRVGLNRTTVHRLVGTLEACGMIRRDRATQKYTLSARILRLSDIFLQHSDIRAVALASMFTLRDKTNETVALHLREGMSRIVIAQVGANRDVRHMYRNLGEPIALHLGAPGKVILAHESPEEIAAYLDHGPLVGTTSHSVTDPVVLGQDLATIARQGYAVSSEERSLGVVSLAAPIFDATGMVVASVNVSGPSQRIRKADLRAFAPIVVEIGREISHELGYLGGEQDGHHGAPSSFDIDKTGDRTRGRLESAPFSDLPR